MKYLTSLKRISVKRKLLLVFFGVAIFFAIFDLSSVLAFGTAETDIGGYAAQVGMESGSIKSEIYTVLGWIIYGIAWTVGKLTSFLIAWLFEVASWPNFVNVDAVTEGWKMVRNLSNMFFILILLVIAFATILRLESYNVKKLLPKVIIMAVLINFSKTICQLIIEFAQVIMITFVNAFSVNGSANLVDMLGIEQMWKMARDGSAKGNEITLTVVGGLLIALIAMLIAVVVIVTMMAMLVMRIIMLWIYIVLSPLAYLMAAFPQGQKYSGQWWGDFTKNVITGPVLAFFIWLALSTAQTSTKGFPNEGIATSLGASSNDGLISSFLSVDTFQTYIITIGFLVGGLVVTQQIGGVASSVAGKGINALQSGKKWTMNKGKELGMWGAGKTWDAAKTVGQVGLAGLSTVDRYAGRKLMGEAWGQKGVVGGAAQTLWNGPGNVFELVKGYYTKDVDTTKHRRDLLSREDENGVVLEGEKRYKANSAGYYQEVDENNNVRWDGEMLKHDEEFVERMNDGYAAAHDSWNAVRSGSQAAKNKAEEERIDKAQKMFADSNMTTGEMRRLFNSDSTSRDKKLALAMTLAIKEGFKSKSEIDRAKSLVKGNTLMSKKLNDEVDKNQAHLAYDFKSDLDRAKFKKRVDAGKIDSTKMKAEAYSNGDILSALEEHHGRDFNRVMETSYKRGKKYEDNVSRGLLARRGDGDLSDDKSAALHAKLTGEVHNSFAKKNNQGFDDAAFGKYVMNAKAKDLNNIDAEDLAKLQAPAIAEMVNNMTYSKLKSMNKIADNPELVRAVKGHMMSNPTHAASIRRDAELRSIT